ncbi:hypothetical protein ACIBCM_08675 [Streptomyces sp. NPDC051018]|uniref:hypothetical protein n=1 Tax=Streptomyces sp. NPDC051018 TaxID=3365639 RepID=UPI0037B369CF
MAVAPVSPETGHPPSPPFSAGTQTFGLALPPAGLTVHSEVPGLREAVTALVHPLFEVTDTVSPGASRLWVVPRAGRALPGEQELLTAPQMLLHPDGPRLAVLESSHERTVVVRHGEQDSAPLVITARPDAREMTVEMPDGLSLSVRALVRLLGSLLGTQLIRRGAVFLHGSAVAADGASIVMLGPKHRGKSSLAFLAVTLCGADFVSDDTLVVWADHKAAPPVLRGWPKRVGIGTALLAGHPARGAFERARLRRRRQGDLRTAREGTWSTGPESRKRLFTDLDEFTALTGASIATGTRPAGIVLPRADRDRRGWRIEPVADRAGALRDSVLAGGELRNYSDYLSLLSGPRPEPDVRAAVFGALDDLPCVTVEYGPDANADFPRFWGEITAALALPGREGR